MSGIAEETLYVEQLTVRLRREHERVRSLREFAVARLRRARLSLEWFDAVADVSFRLRRGQVLAVIGPNGAGKTTLLRALAGIVPPARGCIRVRGRVAPLIELGAGFDPELTGAENVLLYGCLLGAARATVRSRVAEIAEFSELQMALDVPVKNYSSGMVARLGFAVATALEPDILLVDEVLAVGDASFRRRCERRVEDLRSAGTSIVLVTHDLELALSQADAALLLDGGRVVAGGAPATVVNAYKERIAP